MALVFEKPIRTDIRYDDVKSLLIAAGANIREEWGSNWIRDFLMQIGVKP